MLKVDHLDEHCVGHVLGKDVVGRLLLVEDAEVVRQCLERRLRQSCQGGVESLRVDLKGPKTLSSVVGPLLDENPASSNLKSAMLEGERIG